MTFAFLVPCSTLLVLRSKSLRSRSLGSRSSVPADSRVTFFPKPKKVTKERFARRLALLARGGRCVNQQRLLMNKVMCCFVFAAELLW